ncbi:MAG: hypothetical protein U0531_19500 [Dehalococcoidia bacterium]
MGLPANATICMVCYRSPFTSNTKDSDMHAFGRFARLAMLVTIVVVAGAAMLVAAPAPSAESAATRPYLMAMGGLQAVPNGQEPLYKINTPLASLAAEADIVYLHLELYGIPWDEFAVGPEPPAAHPWTVIMNGLAQQHATTGRPAYLGLLLGRMKLAQRAENNNGALRLNDNWAPSCFDFGGSSTSPADALTKRTAYLRYVQWMMATFNPKYVGVTIEINDYWENCTFKGEPVSEWNAFAEVSNAAYAAAKAARSDAWVFPTFNANALYGYYVLSEQCAKPMTNQQCTSLVTAHYDSAYAAITGLQRDRFGLSAWPYLAQTYDQRARTSNGRAFMTVSAIPSDYFTRAAARGAERTFISETGWNSDNLILKASPITPCTTYIASSLKAQGDYLDLIFNKAQSGGIDAIAWWSNRDAIPQNVMTGCYTYATGPTYSACNGDIWCVQINFFREAFPTNPSFGELVFKAWGTNGIRRYDGSTKSTSYTKWTNALATPYAAP